MSKELNYVINKKSHIKHWIIALVLVIFVALGFWCGKLMWFKPFSINHFYERVLIKYALDDPQQMSELGIFGSFGRHLYNSRLTDPSFEHSLKLYSLAEKEQKILKSYTRSKQTKAELLSTDILNWYLNNILEGKEYMYIGFPVNNYLGIQKQLPQYMINSHIIIDKKDAENYIKRIAGFGPYFDEVLKTLKLREAKKIIPPSYIITNTINDMQSFTDEPSTSNALYTSFEQKIGNLDLSKNTKETLCLKLKNEIESVVYPAYRKIITYYKELTPKSKDYVGIWNLPNGDDYYAYMIRNYTTLNITPKEVYERTEKEVKKLNEDIIKLNKKLAGADPVITAAKPITSLKDCQAIVDNMFKKLPQIFGTLPKAKVEVQFTPDSGGSQSGIEQYNPSDINGIRPATIFIPREFLYSDSYTINWVLYHEGVPGHHLQFAINNELKNVPSFRKLLSFPAFSEGWATYAQHLPWEYGLLKEDPKTEIDMLKTKLVHAGRVMIDVGINYKHWTREQTIKFALDNNICDEAGANFYAEYCTAYPGNECSYEIGYLKILELRDKAISKLGNKFNIKEFHDAVLKNGSLPLTILENQVE
jgi:uncharacterized protein (DUF885 family)